MSRDPRRLAAFWSAALGVAVQRDGDDEVMVADDDWSFPRYTFQRVDDDGRSNAMHLDLSAADRVAEVARLVALGATEVRTVTEGDFAWTVMRDPDGNELCVTDS